MTDPISLAARREAGKRPSVAEVSAEAQRAIEAARNVAGWTLDDFEKAADQIRAASEVPTQKKLIADQLSCLATDTCARIRTIREMMERNQ